MPGPKWRDPSSWFCPLICIFNFQGHSHLEWSKQPEEESPKRARAQLLWQWKGRPQVCRGVRGWPGFQLELELTVPAP